MSLLVVIIFSSIYITSSSFFPSELQECIKSQRIIGGICTSIADRPFQALLFIQKEPKCGASIISKRWILTAAHCVQSVPEQYITISVGSSRVRGSTAQYYSIDAKIVHENFSANRSMVENDIALLKTSKSIEYNRSVRSISLNCIPPKAGDDTMVSGYGVTAVDNLSETSEYLMSVDGKVIGTNQCKSILKKNEPRMKLSRGTLCAGNLNGGKDSCHGDSGGPITIVPGNVLIGIVSWGLKCAEKMMPAFYTDVSYYIDWIVENIRQNVCSKRGK